MTACSTIKSVLNQFKLNTYSYLEAKQDLELALCWPRTGWKLAHENSSWREVQGNVPAQGGMQTGWRTCLNFSSCVELEWDHFVAQLLSNSLNWLKKSRILFILCRFVYLRARAWKTFPFTFYVARVRTACVFDLKRLQLNDRFLAQVTRHSHATTEFSSQESTFNGFGNLD